MKKFKVFESKFENQGAVEDYLDNFISKATSGQYINGNVIVDLSQFED